MFGSIKLPRLRWLSDGFYIDLDTTDDSETRLQTSLC